MPFSIIVTRNYSLFLAAELDLHGYINLFSAPAIISSVEKQKRLNLKGTRRIKEVNRLQTAQKLSRPAICPGTNYNEL